MAKREDEQRIQILQYGKVILLGGIFAFLFSITFLLFVSWGISIGKISISLQYQLSVVACILGSFFGGVIAVRQSIGKRLFVGLLVGIVLFLFQLTIGILSYPDFTLENGSMGLLCGALCGGTAASILTGSRRKKSDHKKRNKKF